MRNVFSALGFLALLMSFQNCAMDVKDGQAASSSQKSIGAPLESQLKEITFDTYRLTPSGTVTNLRGTKLDKFNYLAADIAVLFAESSLCHYPVPTGALTCMAYTVPYARAITTDLDQNSFELITNPLCLQDHYDLCGDDSQKLRDIMAQIRGP